MARAAWLQEHEGELRATRDVQLVGKYRELDIGKRGAKDDDKTIVLFTCFLRSAVDA